MKLFVGYATTEGHTRKIARHVADRLCALGHTVEMMPLSEAGDGVDLGRFDGAVLAASVHVGHYQKPLVTFVSDNAEALAARPTLFLSVSLAAAGHDASDWRALDEIYSDLCEATGWSATRVAQVAGAYCPSRYDLFRRLIMRRILAAKDPDANPSEDKEYTDWAALSQTVADWANSI